MMSLIKKKDVSQEERQIEETRLLQSWSREVPGRARLNLSDQGDQAAEANQQSLAIKQTELLDEIQQKQCY